jgi:hypothetical protein
MWPHRPFGYFVLTPGNGANQARRSLRRRGAAPDLALVTISGMQYSAKAAMCCADIAWTQTQHHRRFAHEDNGLPNRQNSR